MMVAPSGAAPRQSKCVGPSTCRARAAQRAPLSARRSAPRVPLRAVLHCFWLCDLRLLSVNGCFLFSRSPILQRRAASHQPSHMRVAFASGHGAGGGGPEGAPRRRGWRSGQRCRTSIPRRARRARAPATPGARPPPRRPPPRGPPRAARARRPRGSARPPRPPRPPEPARARRGGAVRVSRGCAVPRRARGRARAPRRGRRSARAPPRRPPRPPPPRAPARARPPLSRAARLTDT